MLGSLILYLKGMRMMMFQLSGYYCTRPVSPKAILRRVVSGTLETHQTRNMKPYLEYHGT